MPYVLRSTFIQSLITNPSTQQCTTYTLLLPVLLSGYLPPPLHLMGDMNFGGRGPAHAARHNPQTLQPWRKRSCQTCQSLSQLRSPQTRANVRGRSSGLRGHLTWCVMRDGEKIGSLVARLLYFDRGWAGPMGLEGHCGRFHALCRGLTVSWGPWKLHTHASFCHVHAAASWLCTCDACACRLHVCAGACQSSHTTSIISMGTTSTLTNTAPTLPTPLRS